MEVNKKKKIFMYFTGFMLAMIIPKNYFIQIMSVFYNKMNEKITILEDDKNYK